MYKWSPLYEMVIVRNGLCTKWLLYFCTKWSPLNKMVFVRNDYQSSCDIVSWVKGTVIYWFIVMQVCKWAKKFLMKMGLLFINVYQICLLHARHNFCFDFYQSTFSANVHSLKYGKIKLPILSVFVFRISTVLLLVISLLL